MSKETEDELRDVVVWYEYHKSEASDVVKRQEFQEKTINNLMNICILQAADIQRLEHRNPEDPDKKAFDFGSLIVKA